MEFTLQRDIEQEGPAEREERSAGFIGGECSKQKDGANLIVRFVVDTNVLISALRSPRGASYALISALPISRWELSLSLPVYLEYQALVLRPGLLPPSLPHSRRIEICQFLASIAHHQEVYFKWPSFLPDAKDDMLLELAVAAGAGHIVTHNARHFRNVISFGAKAVSPVEFLRISGVIS